MRTLSSLIARRKEAVRRPPEAGHRRTEKREGEDKPARKRCLNEAAHKLDR